MLPKERVRGRKLSVSEINNLQDWLLNNKYTMDSPFKGDLVLQKSFDGKIIKSDNKKNVHVQKVF